MASSFKIVRFQDTEPRGFETHEEIEADDEQDSELLDSEDESDGDGSRQGFDGDKLEFSRYNFAERRLHESLNQQQGGDLAFHLYATHRLKRQCRRRNLTEKETSSGSKRSWSVRPGETEPFVPSNIWTNWPLPPGDVPREWEQFTPGLIPEPVLRPPTAWVQDILVALIQKLGRKQFENREIEIAVQGPSVAEHRRLKPDFMYGPQFQRTFIPQFLLDDERAEALIKPVARSILSSLEPMLLALHTARKHTYYHPLKTHKRKKGTDYSEFWRSEIVGLIDAEVATRKRNVIAARKASKKKKLKLALGRSPTPSADEAESLPKPTKTDHGRKLKLYPRSPRDWVELLAAAGHVGISSAVLEKTTKRCQLIFGEDAKFHTIHPDGQVIEGFDIPSDTPDSEDAVQVEETGEFLGGIRRDNFLIPLGPPGDRTTRMRDERRSWREARRQSAGNAAYMIARNAEDTMAENAQDTTTMDVQDTMQTQVNADSPDREDQSPRSDSAGLEEEATQMVLEEVFGDVPARESESENASDDQHDTIGAISSIDDSDSRLEEFEDEDDAAIELHEENAMIDPRLLEEEEEDDEEEDADHRSSSTETDEEPSSGSEDEGAAVDQLHAENDMIDPRLLEEDASR